MAVEKTEQAEACATATGTLGLDSTQKGHMRVPVRRRDHFCAKQTPEISLVLGEGDVGAEADHAETGGNPLAATECGAGLELATERNG